MTTESILKTSVLIRDQLTSREKERGEGERERDINIDYASLQGSHDSDDLILAHLLVTY